MTTLLCQPAVRRIQGRRAVEVYLTITAEHSERPAFAGESLYSEVRDVLRHAGARLLQERLFAPHNALGAILTSRNRLLAEFDDGMSPTCLVMPPLPSHQTAAVQVHAVVADEPPQVMHGKDPDHSGVARLMRVDQDRWLYGQVPGQLLVMAPAQQAARVLRDMASILNQAGGQMHSVARTWYWLNHILDWYGDFNQARNHFFRSHGLIRPDGRPVHLPASTGIGVGNPAGGAITLEWIALPGQENRIRPIEAGGHQNSAFNYGSAFSRACLVPSPAGQTLYISGTAAINAAGETEHVGHIEKQVSATFEHVRALLDRYGCADSDVLTSIAYAARPEVLNVFEQLHATSPWPTVTLLADVCRPNLLFEVELTAKVN